MPTTSGIFNTITRASGCLHRVHVSQNAGTRSLEQKGMSPVDLAGDVPARLAGSLPIGWIYPVAQRAEPANWQYQEVPDSSIYMPLIRAVRHIAGSFGELPIASRFICIFKSYMFLNYIERLHI